MWILDRLLLPRETWELALLNRIWEKFNDKELTPLQTRRAIYRHSWKYHHDKIETLLIFTDLIKPQ